MGSTRAFTRHFLLLFRMARPAQVLAVFLVYTWGVILAWRFTGVFTLAIFLAGWLPLALVSISIHYANEYADYETEALTVRTPFLGSSGALHDLQMPRSAAIWAAWAAMIAGIILALGSYAVGYTTLVPLGVLILGGFPGWMYSVTPLALAWSRWGEVTNAFLGGVLLPVYGFSVIVGQIDWRVILVSLPFGLLVFLNLLATTWPDRAADAEVGKYTLATRLPMDRLRLLYLLVSFLTYLVIILFLDILPALVLARSLLVLPFSFWAWRACTRHHSPFPSVSVTAIYLVVQIAGWLV